MASGTRSKSESDCKQRRADIINESKLFDDEAERKEYPNPPAQSNSPANCDAPIQPMPSSKPQPRKAPIQQPALHKNCNYPAHKPRHNQNNQAHRDCINSTGGSKPNQAYLHCNNSMRSHKPNSQKHQASQPI
ncbi:hypothetical protein Bpfe_005871 [Biomphalaria pfeifferi]|uniref:Uncharacterized protein n=1 Tax=Biomphalaria pfeifferi TaxID=112525 RepID=A0AAD8C1J6_BIOPF|nr:hypothetical protein Bpfe_005871 [Biomphalaria pfeifferi]